MPSRLGRRMRLGLVVAMLGGLGATLLVLESSTFPAIATGAESGWRGGQYRDAKAADAKAAAPSTSEGTAPSTRSTRGTLTLGQTAVQRPRLSPGESVTLRAVYEVTSPIDVRETRVIHYDGQVLARLERVVTRAPGMVESDYLVKVPRDAAEGWYAVATTIEPARAATRAADTERKETGFYVEKNPPKEATPAPADATAPAGDEAVAIKLWTNQAQYRVGDRISLGFSTNRDAYVTLVNVGTSGEVTILFPNRFSGGHGVKAGKTYTVPESGDSYELQVKGPPGVELVYALATLKPVIFLPTDFQSSGRTFHSVTDRASSFTRDINVAARSIPLREQAKAMVQLEVAR